jgi:hypothetical protein
MVDEENRIAKSRVRRSSSAPEGGMNAGVAGEGSGASGSGSAAGPRRSSLVQRISETLLPHGRSYSSLPDGASSHFLSRERWEDLEWDHTGRITFREFIVAFMAWVGVDEDDEDDESVSSAPASPIAVTSAAAAHGATDSPAPSVRTPSSNRAADRSRRGVSITVPPPPAQ